MSNFAPRKRTKKETVMKTTMVIVMALSALAACSPKPERRECVRNVVVVKPERPGTTVVRHYTGTVRPVREVSLGFKTAGEISRIYVAEGDRVRKGQLLARLDDSDYKLGVEALQIQYDQLSKEVERLGQLHRNRSLSSNDYGKAAAGLKQLGVQLELNKRKVAYTSLYAPADGCIKSVHFSEAEMVDAGMPMFDWVDLSNLKVRIDLPAAEYRQRADFLSFTCMAASGDSERYALEVLDVSPEVDGNQLHSMQLTFKERPDDSLVPGTVVQVSVETAARQRQDAAFKLPLSALFSDGAERCVWVLSADSTVEKRAVELSDDCAEGYVFVQGGLTGDEQVVRAGASYLREGEKVKVLPAPSATNVGGLL